MGAPPKGKAARNKRHAEPFDRPVSFKAEWYDSMTDLTRDFVVVFFPDNTVEIHEGHKIFLSKIFVETLSTRDFYIGSVIIVVARSLQLVDYADQGTRDYLTPMKGRAFALLLPGSSNLRGVGKVLKGLQQGTHAGVVLANMRMTLPPHDEAVRAVQAGQEGAGGEGVTEELGCALEACGGEQGEVVVAFEVVTDARFGGWDGWCSLCDELKQELQGGLFYSSSPAEALAAIGVFFSGGALQPHTAADLSGRTDCSLCLVKPHVIRSGQLADVLGDIEAAGYGVLAVEMLTLDVVSAAKFFEAYRQVLKYYRPMLEATVDGPLVALQVVKGNSSRSSSSSSSSSTSSGSSGSSSGESSVVIPDFRALCGPMDPEVAAALRPSSLRAKYGEDRPTNAVHCTDLAEDGLLECTYFFNVLLA